MQYSHRCLLPEPRRCKDRRSIHNTGVRGEGVKTCMVYTFAALKAPRPPSKSARKEDDEPPKKKQHTGKKEKEARKEDDKPSKEKKSRQDNKDGKGEKKEEKKESGQGFIRRSEQGASSGSAGAQVCSCFTSFQYWSCTCNLNDQY